MAPGEVGRMIINRLRNTVNLTEQTAAFFIAAFRHAATIVLSYEYLGIFSIQLILENNKQKAQAFSRSPGFS